MKVNPTRIVAFMAAVFFSAQLLAQNANNPNQLALLRWYQANQVTQFSACAGADGLAFDGAHMWVACFQAGQLDEFNVSDGSLVRTVSIGYPLTLLYDGANIWATSEATNPGALVKIQASTGTILGTFTVGTAGSTADYMTFDGQYVWVAIDGTTTVSKLLATTGAVTTYALPTCTNPQGMAFDGSHVWVSCASNSPGTILELSLTGTVLKTVTVGLAPTGMAFDGTNIWVANFSGASVSRVNVSTSAVTTFSVGSAPTDVAFDGKYIWVTNVGSFTISKLLASTGAVVGTFSTGSYPYFLAFDGANIWVANQGSATVSKF